MWERAGKEMFYSLVFFSRLEPPPSSRHLDGLNYNALSCTSILEFFKVFRRVSQEHYLITQH